MGQLTQQLHIADVIVVAVSCAAGSGALVSTCPLIKGFSVQLMAAINARPWLLPMYPTEHMDWNNVVHLLHHVQMYSMAPVQG